MRLWISTGCTIAALAFLLAAERSGAWGPLVFGALAVALGFGLAVTPEYDAD